MIKYRIGIAAARFASTTNSFEDYYKMINNYVKAVTRPDVIPHGLIFPNGEFDESYLDLCDGFILQGGHEIQPHYLGIIHYAYTHNKPVLGICLGCQAIGLYGNLLAATESTTPSSHDLLTYFQAHQDDPAFQLRAVEGHLPPTDYTNEIFEQVKHPVQLQPGTHLQQIFATDTISAPSLHRKALPQASGSLVVNALAGDVIEGVELIDDDHFLLGVQFHPELSPEYSVLFDAFLAEVRSRRPS